MPTFRTIKWDHIRHNSKTLEEKLANVRQAASQSKALGKETAFSFKLCLNAAAKSSNLSAFPVFSFDFFFHFYEEQEQYKV